MKRALALMLLAGLAACASGPGSRRGERAPDGQRVLRGYDGSQLERTASPSAQGQVINRTAMATSIA